MASEKEFKKGNEVSWDSRNGEVEGTVVKKVTGTAHIKGHTAKATKENPEYEVESNKTGAHAIHKPEELRKK